MGGPVLKGSAPPSGDTLFMGEQEDPELQNLLARGDTFVYGVNRGLPGDTPLPEHPRSPPRAPYSGAGLWVSNGGALVRCGCGLCFYGPCSSPRL